MVNVEQQFGPGDLLMHTGEMSYMGLKNGELYILLTAPFERWVSHENDRFLIKCVMVVMRSGVRMMPVGPLLKSARGTYAPSFLAREQ